MAVSFQEAPRKPAMGTPSLNVPPRCCSRFNRQTLCKWIWQKGDLLHIFSSGSDLSSAVGWSGPFPVTCRGPHRHLCLLTEHLPGYCAGNTLPPSLYFIGSSVHACPLLQNHRAVFTWVPCRLLHTHSPLLPTRNYRRSLVSAYCLRALCFCFCRKQAGTGITEVRSFSFMDR